MHMPTSAPDAAIALAALRIKKFCITQKEISKAIGASQSQISRILSGRTSASSKLALDLCTYVSLAVGGVSREAVAGNDELMDALKDVWDGTPAHARALATVIRSLGLFKSPPLQDRSTS